MFIDRNDVLYVADSVSGQEGNPGWKRGIRIGSARDGAVTAFIPDPTPDADPITAAEAVAADVDGNVYGAVVPARQLLKYARGQTAGETALQEREAQSAAASRANSRFNAWTCAR